MNILENIEVEEHIDNKYVNIVIYNKTNKKYIDDSLYHPDDAETYSDFDNMTLLLFGLEESHNLSEARKKLKPYYKKEENPLEKLGWKKHENHEAYVLCGKHIVIKDTLVSIVIGCDSVSLEKDSILALAKVLKENNNE